jgi:hypothetical protein
MMTGGLPIDCVGAASSQFSKKAHNPQHGLCHGVSATRDCLPGIRSFLFAVPEHGGELAAGVH